MNQDKKIAVKIANLMEALAELSGQDLEEAKIILRSAGKDPDAILKKGMAKLESIQSSYSRRNKATVKVNSSKYEGKNTYPVIGFDAKRNIIHLVTDATPDHSVLGAEEVFKTLIRQLPLGDTPYAELQIDEKVSRIRFQKIMRPICFQIEIRAENASVSAWFEAKPARLSLTPADVRKMLQTGYIVEANAWYPVDSESLAFANGFILDVNDDGTMSLFNALKYFARRKELHYVFFEKRELDQGKIFTSEAYSSTSKLFIKDLYPYQKDGLKWLQYCCINRIGGILGDDMGLGKTAQTIALVAWIIEHNLYRNTLIVVPSTLLENWRREFSFFCPAVIPWIHHGNNRTGSINTLETQRVVITSYSMIINDMYLFNKLNWGLVLLDEASLIKNPESERRIALVQIPSEVRIVMSGTPVENSLVDLWSLADYVRSGYLGSREEFAREYIKRDIESTLREADLAQLKESVSYIMLRRKKEDVLSSLPDKIDIHQALVMNEEEASEYEERRTNILSLGVEGNKGQILQLIQALRQYTTHPFLKNGINISDASISELKSASVKFYRTIELLDEIRASNDKVLIFTEYHEMIDVFKRVLSDHYKTNVFTIDGRVEINERQNNIDRFSEISGFSIMVLNPRTAGMGLNITAANNVIHYTRQWNPALEEQSTARAYRNGQKKGMNAYYLYYIDTIEEIIDQRLKAKKNLSGEVITAVDSEMSIDEYLDALNKSPLQ